MTDKIPKGHHTITPHLIVRECAKAIDFYKKAFGAEELARLPGPGGKLVHAQIKIGDSIVMLADEFPEMGSKAPQSFGGTPASLMIYCEDVDRWFQRAVEAGAQVAMPVADMFWGDRYGRLTDPFGHEWAIATHVRDVTTDEMMQAMQAQMGQ